jgi:mannose-1-phosphate guanylyltransferase / mannose-6-phosphate isomerase
VQTEKSMNKKIMPVIMCGGSGTRMWPESRESLPKQFIPLIGQRSTFQSIIGVVSDPTVFGPASIASGSLSN